MEHEQTRQEERTRLSTECAERCQQSTIGPTRPYLYGAVYFHNCLHNRLNKSKTQPADRASLTNTVQQNVMCTVY